MSALEDRLARFLAEQLPDLETRINQEGDAIVIRYGVALPRGRRFPPLFRLRRNGSNWIGERSVGADWRDDYEEHGLLSRAVALANIEQALA